MDTNVRLSASETNALQRLELLLSHAKLAFTKKDYTRACSVYTEIIARAPETSEFYLHRACTFALMNNLEAAGEDIKIFIQRNPEWPKTKPQQSGYLKKQNPRKKGSKNRYFYLKNKFLWYYKKPTDLAPLGVICLENFSINDKEDRKFDICTSSRTYVLYAHSDLEKSEWLRAFAKVPSISVQDIQPSIVTTREILDSRAMGEGYLYKKGRMVSKGYKLRWFSLRNHWLSYSESPTDVKPLGIIDLSTMSEACTSTEDQDGKYQFEIFTPHRTYYLYSERVDERERWIALINKAGESNSSNLTREYEKKQISPPNSIILPEIKYSSPTPKSPFIRVSDTRNSALEVSVLEPPALALDLGSTYEEDEALEKKRNKDAVKVRKSKPYLNSGITEELSVPFIEVDIKDRKEEQNCCSACTIV